MSDTTTIYYENGNYLPYDSLSEGTKQVINQAWQAYHKQQQDDPGYLPFILVMIFFIAFGYILVKKAWKIKGWTLLGTSNDQYDRQVNRSQEIRDQLQSDYFVYEGRDIVIAEAQYDKILQKHSAYYRHLVPELKEKFLHRTRKFIATKTFLIKSNEPFIEMPVLLSATAVQITFGLEQYLLPHYQYIRIYPEEYFAGDSLKVLAGHVYGNTITVSWNHFLQGFEEHNDGVNLGLHEMAHALYFQLTEADTGRCKQFMYNFHEVMQEGAEVYDQKHERPSALFTENAYRNLQEFWAESVELFFERPSDLNRENSELYDAMKEILQQDPINELFPVSEA